MTDAKCWWEAGRDGRNCKTCTYWEAKDEALAGIPLSVCNHPTLPPDEWRWHTNWCEQWENDPAKQKPAPAPKTPEQRKWQKDFLRKVNEDVRKWREAQNE